MCCGNRFPILFLVGFVTVLVARFAASSGSASAEEGTVIQQTQTKEDKKVDEVKLLRHVVLFQFKDSSSKDDVKKVVEAFRELPKSISVIADFEWGTNNSPEGLNDGLTHGFVITFKSEKDRDTYLNHPAHKAFVDILLPHLQKPVVVDFWVNK